MNITESRTGKFLVVEGTDGSGKRTQIELLSSYLEGRGYETLIVDFPQYRKTLSGSIAGRYLKGDFGGIDTSPYLATYPYAVDRLTAKDEIENALLDGIIVLANRYTPSSKAFQTVKLPLEDQDSFIDFVDTLEYGELSIPREDAVLLLKVRPEISQKLVDSKSKREWLAENQPRDIHEANLSYQEQVAEMYLKLANRYPHWFIVECCSVEGNLLSTEIINVAVIETIRQNHILPI